MGTSKISNRYLYLGNNENAMVMKKKIRGGRRRGRIIADWNNVCSESLRLDVILHRHYDYERVVHPWKVYSRTKTLPPSQFRNEMIRGLIDRYEHWDTELKKLGEPYYLKIWLYDKMFFESQIVAAIRERILWHEQLFEPIENKLVFPFKLLASPSQNPPFSWIPVNEISYPTDEDELTKENCIRNLVWIGYRREER